LRLPRGANRFGRLFGNTFTEVVAEICPERHNRISNREIRMDSFKEYK
jgi:hypothetical protein